MQRSSLPLLFEVGLHEFALALDCSNIIGLSGMILVLIATEVNLPGDFLDPNVCLPATCRGRVHYCNQMLPPFACEQGDTTTLKMCRHQGSDSSKSIYFGAASLLIGNPTTSAVLGDAPAVSRCNN